MIADSSNTTVKFRDFSGFLRRKKERIRQAKEEANRKKKILQDLFPIFFKYGVLRAYIFGSVNAGACRKDSDIDLYVEGVEPSAFWNLWKDLENQSNENIDLVCDRDDPVFVQKIKKRGKLIYEAKHSTFKS
jgi:predicted nucleotidyltransferase